MSAANVATDSTEAPEQKKSKRPANTAFKQQRLPAWQPVMTAKTVIPAFFVIGVIFIPVGAVLYTTSQAVKEHVIDYTMSPECKDCYNSLNTTDAHETTYDICTCNITFNLDSEYESPVYMYYGLDNFYQNHRRYVKSRDDTQLLGEKMSLSGKSALCDDCDPYRQYNDSVLFAPCGAIANSIFNDSLTLRYNGSTIVPLLKTGIAWVTDRKAKFKNPTLPASKNLCEAEALLNTAKPPNWPKPLCELDIENPENNGYQNEDLIVWMRNAALPNFRKLYRRIDHDDAEFKDGLPAGSYTLNIEYKYPVKAFGGRKRMILSTVSWLGGKNPFLGVAYIVVGVLCIILAFCFLIIHYRLGRSDQETVDVNNRTPYSN